MKTLRHTTAKGNHVAAQVCKKNVAAERCVISLVIGLFAVLVGAVLVLVAAVLVLVAAAVFVAAGLVVIGLAIFG